MTDNTALALQFSNECTVFELKYEYTDYTGYERFGIITALTGEQLVEKYGSILDAYKPYIVLDLAFAEVRHSFNKNEWKHEKRAKRSLSYGIDDEDFEAHHQECASPDCMELVLAAETKEKVWRALDKLTPLQKKRVVEHYMEGRSIRQIASEEGVDFTTVRESIASAMRKLKKVF